MENENWRVWEGASEYGELLFKRATGELDEMESSKALCKIISTFYEKGMKIADVGCGAGHYLRSLRNRVDKAIDYTGIDATENYISLAKKAFPQMATFKIGDILDLPFDNDFFDIENKELFELVIDRCEKLGSTDQVMFVIGATKSKFMKNIRARVPDHFFLIPGVGAQGGSLMEVAQSAMNDHCGILVNASRSIIYASPGEDFAQAAASEAKSMQQSMKEMLKRYL